MSLERAPVAGDGDGAVHELLDWRLSALESATPRAAQPRSKSNSPRARTASYQLYPSTVGRSDSALSQSVFLLGWRAHLSPLWRRACLVNVN